MSDAVIEFFKSLSLNSGVVVFLVSMLPIVELRGAIPLALLYYQMNPWLSYLIAVLGNLIPVPFILLFIRPIMNWLKRTRAFSRFGNWLDQKAAKGSAKVKKYEMFGLFLFVAIPLPGTGAWTGSLIAAVMNMRMRDALPSIVAGVLTAGLIMTFGSNIINFIVGLF